MIIKTKAEIAIKILHKNIIRSHKSLEFKIKTMFHDNTINRLQQSNQ